MVASAAPQRWERIGVFASALVFVAAVLVLAVAFPEPTRFQEFVFRIVLALAASAFGAFVPGVLNIDSLLESRGWNDIIVTKNRIRAGGALALFVLVLLVNPPALVSNTMVPISGRVQDDVGRPLAGAVVGVVNYKAQSTSDDGGTFEFELRPRTGDGAVRFFVHHPQYTTAWLDRRLRRQGIELVVKMSRPANGN